MTENQWTLSLQQIWADYSQGFVAYLPSLLAALVLFVGGWLCAKLGRMLTIKFVSSLYQLGQKFAQRRGIQQNYISHNAPHVIANIVYWLIILLFLVAVAKALRLDIFSSWLYHLISYLPALATGILIIITGLIFGNVIRDLIFATLPTSSFLDRNVLSRSAQIVIIATAIIIGSDQMGINVNFLIVMSAVATGVFLGGLVLAFSLGAQTHVRDLIASRQIQNQFQLGQYIRIKDLQGRIIAILPQSVVLETEKGKVSLPSRLFMDEVIHFVEDTV